MSDLHIHITGKSYQAAGSTTPHHTIAKLDLHLKYGEFVCLVGPSGCGKTTLLNLLAGLDLDFDGSIQIGTPQTNPKIGYVFQNPRLLPWRTVRENIELVQEKPDPHAIDALLATMQLSASEHVYPERLSLGMSRRVAIIRAFAANPDLLLMDEPFVSLDAPTARQVRELLLSLWQQRPHSVLFVTHDLREAIALADRLVFLSAAPMQIISEIPVTLPRNQRHLDEKIENFRQQLFTQHAAIKNLL
jgi:NitT/TauT family transport system ATP-binding protein